MKAPKPEAQTAWVAYFVADAYGGYWQTTVDGKPYNFRVPMMTPALSAPASPAALDWALEQGGVLADWCNVAGHALLELSAAYERRVRSDCSPEDLESQPWRCAEFVLAEQALQNKPVPTVTIASPAAQQQPKHWPFVESPGEFTERLRAAMQEFPLIGAVRSVLIENPPTLCAQQPAVVGDGGFDAWWRSKRIDPEFPETLSDRDFAKAAWDAALTPAATPGTEKPKDWCAHCLSSPHMWGMVCCHGYVTSGGKTVQLTESEAKQERARRRAISAQKEGNGNG